MTASQGVWVGDGPGIWLLQREYDDTPRPPSVKIAGRLEAKGLTTGSGTEGRGTLPGGSLQGPSEACNDTDLAMDGSEEVTAGVAVTALGASRQIGPAALKIRVSAVRFRP
jgi:hypothetical protein